jgi:hypothetical protein
MNYRPHQMNMVLEVDENNCIDDVVYFTDKVRMETASNSSWCLSSL